MKKTMFTLAFAFIALFTVNTAQAQNAHFTDVVVSEDGLTITGKVAGLGNFYVGKEFTITYSADVTVTKVCLAPGNNMPVPGQSGTSQLSDEQITKVAGREGNIVFTLTLDPEQVPVLSCTGQGLILDEAASSIEAAAKSLSFTVGTVTVYYAGAL